MVVEILKRAIALTRANLALSNEKILEMVLSSIPKGQSQKHGFIFENIIRTKVFGLPEETNSNNKHDIDKALNRFNNNENISIKSSCGKNVDCGDISRFFSYDFNVLNTMIIVRYKQGDNVKKLVECIELNYNKELHTFLFGSITTSVLYDYIGYVKSIPKNCSKSDKATYDYLSRKKELQRGYDMNISISPKVDSKDQRRVQCSIPNIDTIIKKFPQLVISRSKNIIRGVEIPDSIVSGPRIRNIKTIS
jgi:hypothetical protein